MNVTKNIITDLLPLYYAEECSEDTKRLVEEYLQKNPELKEQAKYYSQNPLPKQVPQSLNKNDEMKSLVKTRKLLKVRSFVMGLAILCSLAPFSFHVTEGKFYWLMLTTSTGSALIYGIIAIISWTVYFTLKRKTNSV